MSRSIDRIVSDMEKYRRVNDDDLQTVIDALTVNILRLWDRERIEGFAKHLLGAERKEPA